MSPLCPLLALIARADAYGYELKRAVDTQFAPAWKIDFAQLYRTLARLRAQGYVRVRRSAHSGGPARQIYSITPRGRHALDRWFRTPADSPDEHWVKARLAASLDLGPQLPLVISGSDDPLLAHLARSARAHTDVIGSMAGLLNLAAGKTEIAGTHLRDPRADEFNISFVQHLVAEQDILLVNLAAREYGLLVAVGNPANISGIRDLARDSIRLVNRPIGSGARVWLARYLRSAGLDPNTLPGWSSAAATYDDVARALQTGTADIGPGLRATAVKFGLSFVPIGMERFDLAIPRAEFERPRVQQFLHGMSTAAVRAWSNSLPGYDLTRSGQIIAQIKYGEL